MFPLCAQQWGRELISEQAKQRTYPAQKGDIISEVVDNILKISSVIAPDTIVFIEEPKPENSGDYMVLVVETVLRLT